MVENSCTGICAICIIGSTWILLADSFRFWICSNSDFIPFCVRSVFIFGVQMSTWENLHMMMYSKGLYKKKHLLYFQIENLQKNM